jgi:hypothetical protein
MDEAIRTLLEKLTNEWAPAALQLGVEMTWYDSLSHIIVGVVALLGCLICIRTAIRLWPSVSDVVVVGDREILFIACLVGSFVLLVFAIGGLMPWNWIGLFNPRVKLAHDIYTALIK